MSTSVKLKFKPSRIDNHSGTVCLQLIHSRKIKLLRTRFKIYPGEWDGKKNEIIADCADTERQNYLQSLKTRLDAEIKQISELIRLLEQRGDYTVKELADLYSNNYFNGYLFPFLDYVVKQRKDDHRNKSATILQTARRSFERFRCGQDILLDIINSDLMQQYETYLKSTGMMKNTTSCYIRALRSAYNQAVKRGLTAQKNPFDNVYTGIDKTVKRAVNEDVIINLKNLDLSAHRELELARDLFMFSFYVRGISFVDMANLRKSNVRNGYIIYSRNKTHRMLTVRLEPCMQEIISKYEAQTVEDYLLPVYTIENQDHVSQLRNHNRRLKRISAMLGQEIHISSYASRHTWATLALRRGIPVEVISESMGHESETTTRIYLASIGQSVVDEANTKIITLE
ncbi:MAG: site-specific integrase [Bacteroidales bacterium]|jgi:integrase|nr:site-specific integrase [Bacteroidales bacterium]